MAGYPSNLAKKYSPTEQFPQHILPLLPLYNAQWWGYESLTALVLVIMSFIEISNLGVHLAALGKHSLHKKGSIGFIKATHQ